MKRHGKILVTGGAGFIGGHLVDSLIKNGRKVRVLDNLTKNVHGGKLPSWFNKKAEFVRGDVRNKKDWEKALEGVDLVFHLASYMDFHPDYSSYIDTNVKSIALMFEVVQEKKLKIRKLIVASSQSVYGEGTYLCKTHGTIYPSSRNERALKAKDWNVYCHICNKLAKPQLLNEDESVHPNNIYGASKYNLEKTTEVLSKILGIPYVLLRYSIVHGPRQTIKHFYSGALRQFAGMALSGEPVVMHEDGQQTRDFVHIEDVINAHLLVMKSPRSNNQIFNIGSGVAYPVRKLANLVTASTGPKLSPETPSLYRIGTSRNSCSSIKKLRALGWKPSCTLKDNVDDYIIWLKTLKIKSGILQKNIKEMSNTGVVRKASIR